MGKNLVQRAIGIALVLLVATLPVMAQLPDHPIITEVFNNATGNDGPTGHNPANVNQEFIEILLPTAANLSPALNKDALNLTYYEIEGDSNSSHLGWVNQRFDLPMFDLDPSNGMTPGSVARPASGIVVLGWVDYNALNPPTALAGTPSTRIGLINNGITTSPAGVTFIAINGAQFGGTTNFEVPTLESRIDIPNEHISGVMKNGSNAYLLVNRDDLGFAALVDHSAGAPTDAGLPGGLILGLTSLLDGFAGNDDLSFVESLQPFAASSLIDLATVLPIGGVFTPWVAQIAEGPGTGYARQYVDVPRTTEDGIPGNEDPALDAVTNYRDVFRTGPFFPTPGTVTLSTSPPELGVPFANRLQFNILSNTTGRPGLICGNIGGDFPIDITVSVGTSDNPALVTFAADAPALGVLGQQEGLPQISATVSASAPDGAIVSAPATFSATNTSGGDPAVLNPVQGSTTSAVVLSPIKAIDALGAPIETTVFAAVQGFGADAVVPNEFLGTDLATFVTANLGTHAGDTLGNLATLLNPATDLEDFATVDLLRQPFPSTFINAAGAPGTDDLVTTLLTSAKVASGSTAYDGSISTIPSGLKAIAFAIPETATFNGLFSASERLFFADAAGGVNLPRGGLNCVTTSRTFELALIDTNVTTLSIESGDSDDFGIIVKAGQVTPTASVASGEFVFLSFTGGLEGEDIDTIDVPGVNATVAILLDLDNLHDVLGIETITQVYVIDADLGGTLNVMEVLSLNTAGVPLPVGACCFDSDADGVNDACTIATAADCAATFAGVYHGDGSVCLGTGACCSAAVPGGCAVMDELCCNDITGTFPGAGSTCADNNSNGTADVCEPPPTGACCFDSDADGVNDACTIATAADCAATFAGVYHGDGSVCLGTGACCSAAVPGGCAIMDELCCNDITGTFPGAGLTCADNNGNGTADVCETPPVGACCFDNDADGVNDACAIVTAANCSAILAGVYHGDGSACLGSGACCSGLVADGCATMDELCCNDIAGTFGGTGTACAGVVAACCLPGGGCADADTQCCVTAMGGVPQSPGSACNDGTVDCTVTCTTAADCADLDGNGITDDVCTWWACDAGACVATNLAKPSDMGGAGGTCPPDTNCNLADALTALKCFSGQSPCEKINIDAGGAAGSCAPDGNCNLADALAALTCFANTNTCTCGPSPTETNTPTKAGAATLRAVADARSIKAGSEVQVRMFVDQPLDALLGYQLTAVTSGGRSGSLELVDIAVEGRHDAVYARATSPFEAFNVESGQMLAGNFDGAVSTSANGYLATFTYRASDDAVGTFVVDVVRNDLTQTMMVGAEITDDIVVTGTRPAVIVVNTSSARFVR